MKFYIVTPSFRSLAWLPRCIRSVADQVNARIKIHHHVQDGGSDDGTVQWLESWSSKMSDIPGYKFTFSSKRDNGMYDAINRAWNLLPEDADVTAHLNCDEQYLHEALEQVARMFEQRKKADILLGTYIVVDRENNYVCHRRPVIPRACLSWLYRASFFRNKRLGFDTKWRNIGDLVFFHKFAGVKVTFSTITDIIRSAFVSTGGTLAWIDSAREERARRESEVPPFRMQMNRLADRWVIFAGILMDYLCRRIRANSVYDGNSLVQCAFGYRPCTFWDWQIQTI